MKKVSHFIDFGGSTNFVKNGNIRIKGSEQRFSKNFRTYYNFVRPHTALKMTPAQASGIEIELELELDKNRWLSLLKKSLSQ